MRRAALSLIGAALLAQAPATTADGFAIARPGYAFHLPQDHGAHPNYRTEWWYATGHLRDAQGKRLGFQLTFFRQATPRAAWKGNAAWRSDHLILAHAAISDEAAGRFAFDERFDREGLVAGAAEDRASVWAESWRLDQRADGSLDLAMEVKGAALSLRLRPQGPPVVFGEDGLSRKGDDPAAASHYVTFPRLEATGALRASGAARTLSGEAWMDHEWSSSYLDPAQVGWDWAGIQLKDGRSIMAFRLRRADGSQDPWSTAQEVGADGRLARSTRTLTMAPEGAWASPASGARYPIPMRVEAFGETFRLVPTLKDQELRTARSTGITYWEGDCRVLDAKGAEIGEAYLELTGYAGTMKGRF